MEGFLSATTDHAQDPFARSASTGIASSQATGIHKHLLLPGIFTATTTDTMNNMRANRGVFWLVAASSVGAAWYLMYQKAKIDEREALRRGERPDPYKRPQPSALTLTTQDREMMLETEQQQQRKSLHNK